MPFRVCPAASICWPEHKLILHLSHPSECLTLFLTLMESAICDPYFSALGLNTLYLPLLPHDAAFTCWNSIKIWTALTCVTHVQRCRCVCNRGSVELLKQWYLMSPLSLMRCLSLPANTRAVTMVAPHTSVQPWLQTSVGVNTLKSNLKYALYFL